MKSKTASNFYLDHQPRNLKNNNNIIINNINKNNTNQHYHAESTENVGPTVFSSNENDDISMYSNTSNLAYCGDYASKLSDENDLLIKKYQLDSLFVEQSILINKISPSKNNF